MNILTPDNNQLVQCGTIGPRWRAQDSPAPNCPGVWQTQGIRAGMVSGQYPEARRGDSQSPGRTEVTTRQYSRTISEEIACRVPWYFGDFGPRR